ncbi:MAG: MFS transporter [Alphaproteobacteria bacterium]
MTPSARMAMIFSSVGHFYIHMMTAFYFVIVLTLVVEWDQPYSELLQLWTIASALLGLVAIPAGRLADRWSVRGMMVLFFIGMGVSSIVCGLVSTQLALLMALSGIGIFGAIYHPVGIPWLIRSASANTGKLLAVNGIFGSLGNAGAAVIAGLLIDLYGWRMAFIVPGVICAITGLGMWWFVYTDRIVDGAAAPDSSADDASRGDFIRVSILLLISLAVGGIIYQSTQTALPKHFETELQEWSWQLFSNFTLDTKSPTGLGAIVSIVYSSSIVMQYVGGSLADRYSLKYIYVICWFLQIAMLAAIAAATGLGLIGAALLAVAVNITMLPAENMLIYRYAPWRHRSLIFGIKFVITFGAAPLSVALVAFIQEEQNTLDILFGGLAAATFVVALLLIFLPKDKPSTPNTAPAE